MSNARWSDEPHDGQKEKTAPAEALAVGFNCTYGAPHWRPKILLKTLPLDYFRFSKTYHTQGTKLCKTCPLTVSGFQKHKITKMRLKMAKMRPKRAQKKPKNPTWGPRWPSWNSKWPKCGPRWPRRGARPKGQKFPKSCPWTVAMR